MLWLKDFPNFFAGLFADIEAQGFVACDGTDLFDVVGAGIAIFTDDAESSIAAKYMSIVLFSGQNNGLIFQGRDTVQESHSGHEQSLFPVYHIQRFRLSELLAVRCLDGEHILETGFRFFDVQTTLGNIRGQDLLDRRFGLFLGFFSGRFYKLFCGGFYKLLDGNSLSGGFLGRSFSNDGFLGRLSGRLCGLVLNYRSFLFRFLFRFRYFGNWIGRGFLFAT